MAKPVDGGFDGEPDVTAPGLSKSVALPRPNNARAVRLVVLTGAATGQVLVLQGDILVGRGPEVQLSLETSEVSRKHAWIGPRGDGWEVADCGSRNGTFLNDAPVGLQPVPLGVGDRIRLGNGTVLLFTLHDPAEDRALQDQKIQALGHMAGLVAHDVINMGAAALANLAYVRKTPRLDADERDACHADCEAAVTRIVEIVRRLLNFSHRSPPQLRRVQLADAARETLALTRHRAHPDVVHAVSIPEDLAVQADPTQLLQALVNLCSNALDAMPDGGRLELRASRAELDEATAPPLSLHPGPYARICVQDTGHGMTPATLARVFEPFFTTKAPGRGTGLGLASTHAIAQAHGGSIDVSSEPGKGTTFELYLPWSDAAKASLYDTARAMPVPRPANDGNLVLLVEDEPLVRRSEARLLKSLGFRVVDAGTGEEAVDIFRNMARDFKFVLLDVNMPKMDGPQTFAALRAVDPDAPVIFISGSVEADAVQPLTKNGGAGFVRKPCNAAELREAISVVCGTATTNAGT